MIILTYMNFGKRLRGIRKEKGLTQVELADKSGLKQGIITHYETGLRTPTLERAVKLADALGVAVEEFCGTRKKTVGKKRIHKNSRVIKIQELFEKLPPSKQENVFQIVKGLIS